MLPVISPTRLRYYGPNLSVARKFRLVTAPDSQLYESTTLREHCGLGLTWLLSTGVETREGLNKQTLGQQ